MGVQSSGIVSKVSQAGALADGDREADIHFPAGGNDSVGVEAAVGPHRELSPGPAVAHPPHRLTQEVGGATGGVGPALAQPGHQHLAGAGEWPAAGDSRGRRYSRGGALPPWPRSIGLADRRVQVSGASRRVRPPAQANNWRLTRSELRHAPTGSGRKVPRVDGALTTRSPTVPPARSASARRCIAARREATSVHLVPRVRPSRHRGQGDGRRAPAGPGAGERIGHQAMVVKEDATVGIVLWQHLLGAPCSKPASVGGLGLSPSTEGHGYSGRGWVRELLGSWGRWEAGGRSSVAAQGPRALCGSAMRGMAREYAAGDSRDRGGASLRGRWVSCRLAVRPGMEWLAAGPRRD